VAASVLKLVRDRFENRCVVCGEREATDVSHIYEDATKRRATSDRLVLLCSNHNQAIQRAHGKSIPDSPDVLPEGLLSGARKSFWEGSQPRGYGQARLASYFFERRGDCSDALDSLTEAISAARKHRWGDWLASIAREAERLCGRYEIGPAARWLFLDRFAIVLFDYARWSESAEVLSAANDIRDRIQSDPYNPQRLTFDKRSSFRRESLIIGSTKTWGKGKSVEYRLAQLEEDAEDFLANGKLEPFVTNLDVARRLADFGGDLAGAHKYAERALTYKDKIMHKWALLEHLVGETEYFVRRSDKNKALLMASEAMSLFAKSPSVLEPILEGSPRQLGIHGRFGRVGISMAELLANGVSIAPEVAGVPLALSKRAIKRVVQVVHANPGALKG